MNQILSNLKHSFTNLHVSIPTVLGAGLAVTAVVLPQYAEKCGAIGAVLVSYGIIAAANTPPSSTTPPQK